MFNTLLERATAIASTIVDNNHYGNNLKYQTRMTNKVSQLLNEMTEIAGIDGEASVKRYSERTTWVKINELLFDAALTEDTEELTEKLLTASALVNNIR